MGGGGGGGWRALEMKAISFPTFWDTMQALMKRPQKMKKNKSRWSLVKARTYNEQSKNLLGLFLLPKKHRCFVEQPSSPAETVTVQIQTF